MRLPVEPPPVVEVPEAPYTIGWRGAVSASPRVAPRTLPPMLIPAHGEAGGQGGGGTETPAAVPPQEERRHTPDRRQYCRRVQEQNTFLDTRGENDRRKGGRRADDPKSGVDLKV